MSVLVRELLKDYYNIPEYEKVDIDTAIKYLVTTNQLSDDEVIVLYLTMQATNYKDIALVAGIDRSTVYRKIIIVSDKLSDYLGEDYQDDRIFKEVETRVGRKLTDEEVEFCEKVLYSGLSGGKSIWDIVRQDEEAG